MGLKAASQILLALLFGSLLASALVLTPLTLHTHVTGPVNGCSAANETDAQKSLRSIGFHDNQSGKEFEIQSLDLKVSDEDTFRQSSSAKGESYSNEMNMWNYSAYANNGSVELVIGVSNTSPNSYSELAELVAENDGKVANVVMMEDEIEAIIVEMPLLAVSSFQAEMKDAELSKYIEPNLKFELNFVPNDPYWALQWGPARIEAERAWDTQTGDPSVLVAVIDTGIDWDHPDLAANYVALGYDWVNSDTDPMDDNGHGTHCAGIIAAVLNNSIGVAGLAQIQIMAEKGIDRYGSGYEDDLANAIIHAVDQGADILSNSWGGYMESRLIYEAVRYACDQGVLVVASAGNEAWDTKLYPAAYDEVIAVTATEQLDNPASFTNFGDWVELAAPGVNIYSTVWDNSYAYKSGTSMSAPHVSGVAALTWSQFPNMSREALRLWLRYTADDLGSPGFDQYYGYGRINARRAMEEVPPDHDLLVMHWDRPLYVEPGSLAVINTTVVNFGANDESDVAIRLLVNGSVIDSASISILASGASAIVSSLWSPLLEGMYNVTTHVMPVPGEALTHNNVVWDYVYVGLPVKAFVLDSAGTDLYTSTWDILNMNWYTFGDTLIHIDYATLNIDDITYADIVASDADVLLISCAAAWEFTDSEIDAIARYVYEGHGLIVTAGTFYYMVPNNNKLARLFGLSETVTWHATATDLLDILYPAHPLFARVPDPYTFPSVGTAVPADNIWDSTELAGGAYLALGHFQESAIVSYRGLVYISPWLEVVPAYYHFNLQVLYNAITWSRYQKPEHELVVSLDSPPSLKPGEDTLLNATVSNMGLRNETSVELFLFVDGVAVNSAIISQLVNGTSYTIDHLWTPPAEATYNITVYAPPVLGEDNTVNNVKSEKVIVSLLLVALFKNVDPWADPANERALSKYGIPYIVLRSSDFGAADLSAFTKVVIASDQDPAFYADMDAYRSWFEDYVSNGGILEVHAADMGWHGGSWLGFLPGGIEWIRYFSNGVEIVDHLHPIVTTPTVITDTELDGWDWSTHGYFGMFPIEAQILIVEEATRDPIYLEIEYGTGFIIVSGQTLEWGYLHKYSHILENSLLYSPAKYEHDLLVTLEAPRFHRPEESALLNATVRNRGLNNESNVGLQLLINGTIKASALIPELPTDMFHTLTYQWIPKAEAFYNVTAYAAPVPGEDKVTNNVATTMVRVRYAPKILVVDTPPLEDTGALDRLGYEYTLVSSTDFVTVDLYQYNVLFVGWTPGTVVVNALLFRASEIADWLAVGNGIAALAEFDEVDRWAWLPLWVNSSSGFHADNVHILNPAHPVMSNLTDDELSHWGNAYHGYFVDYDPAWEALAEGVDVGFPITLAASYGNGRIAITQQDPDYHFYYQNERGAEKLLNNMIEWVAPPIRYLHELVVSLDAPDLLELGDSSLLNATVQNLGLSDETDVELQLLINSTIVESAVIPELLSGSPYTLSHLWIPTVKGLFNITAYAPPVFDESISDNNVFSVLVTVLTLPIVFVDPPQVVDSALKPGDAFTLNVTILGVEGLCGWELSFHYLRDILTATEVIEGAFLKEAGPTFFILIELNDAYNATHGRIRMACMLSGVQQGVDGSGTLATVTFTVDAYGSSIMDLQVTKLFDIDMTKIPHKESDGYFCNLIAGGGAGGRLRLH